ncbi:MAG: nucleotidyltransferase domain-containing protein [Phycisphaerae bacterium]|nr:nucleotidyltransferase domain-containing protein [Phycisphaerae bacterium]
MAIPTPTFDTEAIARFCERWAVQRLWLFGSQATGTADGTSDVDLLVEFRTNARTSTWDWPAMQDELRQVFGRDVDLLSTGVLRNAARRRAIEASRKLLYAA